MTLKTVRVPMSESAKHSAHPVTSQTIEKPIVFQDYIEYTYSSEKYLYFYRYILGVDWSYRFPAVSQRSSPSDTNDYFKGYNMMNYDPIGGTWTWGHGLENGDGIYIRPPTNFDYFPRRPEHIYIGITRTLPTVFDPDTVYYVVNADDETFQVASTPGGAALAHGGSGDAVVCIYDENTSSPWIESEAHYPFNVSFRIVSSNSSTASQSSKSYRFYKVPAYDVWYRFCKTDLPDQTDTDNSSKNWQYLMTTENTYVQPQLFADGPEDYPYIQFAVCGSDRSFYMTNAEEGGTSIVTGDTISVDPANQNIHVDDTQVLFVTRPEPHVEVAFV